jgi:hypothetical protein
MVGFRFCLDGLNPEVRDAVWTAAVPHWFDLDFLTALMDSSDAYIPGIFQSLIGLSFVEPFPGLGYNIHKRTRALLLKSLWQQNLPRYYEQSKRAATYCAHQDQADTGWRVEAIYHLLVARPDDGLSQLRSTGWEWHKSPYFAYDKVEVMARAACEHAEANRLSERGLGWLLFWEALLDCNYSRSIRGQKTTSD